MEFLRYLIFSLMLFEILLYFLKYWNIIPFEKSKVLSKLLYNYGVPLFRNVLSSSHTSEQILEFIKYNIKPKKIVGNTIYLRRKYLKWIQWATPIPLQAIIKLKKNSNTCDLEVKFTSIFTPWIGAIIPILISIYSQELSLLIAVLAFIFFIPLIYLIALVEKAALMSKIKKITNLDESYTLFA